MDNKNPNLFISNPWTINPTSPKKLSHNLTHPLSRQMFRRLKEMLNNKKCNHRKISLSNRLKTPSLTLKKSQPKNYSMLKNYWCCLKNMTQTMMRKLLFNKLTIYSKKLGSAFMKAPCLGYFISLI